MGGDVGHGFVEAPDDPDVENQGEVLGFEVSLGGRK
jgi:hypothetical protein